MDTFSRRDFLCASATGVAFTGYSSRGQGAETVASQRNNFRYSLNFGTLLGFKMSLEEEIDTAARAGYDAVEPWVRKLMEYRNSGKTLSDIRKRIEDHGMAVAGACAFFSWLVNDETARNKGIEQMKREMEILREIGGDRIAATPAGATGERLDDFNVLGERYRTILEIGERMEVIPQLEIWGAVKTMNTLLDAVSVAICADHPRAEFLLDVYHLYRGGSPFNGLELLNGKSMTNFHINDYPADPPREKAQDKDRVYPGDGIAPLRSILQTLRNIGFEGVLSFEVFNPHYWETGNPDLVAKTGLEKMKALSNLMEIF